MCDRAGEGVAVGRACEHLCIIDLSGVVRVHEIHVRPTLDPFKDRVFTLKFDAVPAHMWDVEFGLKAIDAALEEAQPRFSAALGPVLKQDLEA